METAERVDFTKPFFKIGMRIRFEVLWISTALYLLCYFGVENLILNYVDAAQKEVNF